MKPVVTVAVATLVGQGLAALDDPVRKYVPEFCGPSRDDVTIRHLLTHTAGFPNRVGPTNARHGYREVIRAACNFPLPAGRRPGAWAEYSESWAWHLLAEIVTRTTRRELAAISDDVLTGLGVKSDLCWSPPTDRPPYSVVALSRSGRPLAIPEQALGAAERYGYDPAQGGFASAAGLAEIYRGLLHAIGPSRRSIHRAVGLFTKPARVGRVDRLRGQTDFGLGFEVNTSARGFLTPLWPQSCFFHTGSIDRHPLCIAGADPENGYAFALTLTSISRANMRIMKSILTALYQDLIGDDHPVAVQEWVHGNA